MTKEELAAGLKVSSALVTFIKADETVREMNCTLQEEFLPPRSEEKRLRINESDDAIAVWDLDKQAWRSFRLDSLLRIDWPEGNSWINGEMYGMERYNELAAQE